MVDYTVAEEILVIKFVYIDTEQKLNVTNLVGNLETGRK